MKKIFLSIIISMTFIYSAISAIHFQEYGISLKLSRDFGYSSGTGDIQGLFSMKVTGPENLVRVEFYIDELMIGEATSAPYRIQFTTDDYPGGVHTMYAIGFTTDGNILNSREFTANFVSADQGWKTTQRMIIPVVGVLVLAILLAVVIPAVVTRGKINRLPLGSERDYGFHGGAICSKCRRPFGLHLWGMNLGFSRLDRCPYCGKWSVVRIQSLSKLRDAEKAELTWSENEIKQESEEDRIRKEIENSKFQE